MAEQRECPMCGGAMILKHRQEPVQVPGTPKVIKRITPEWVCPDCDYFEEADEERS